MKYPLISTSLSAIGVPASPGSTEIAADAAAAPPVRAMTVSLFSSSDLIVPPKFSGLVAKLPIRKNEMTAAAKSTAAFISFSLFSSIKLLFILVSPFQ